MTKVLLLSDTHGQLALARQIIDAERPDRILHLGDLQKDALQLRATYPEIRLDYVPGNCDFVTGPACIGITTVEGCRIYYTHGHEHRVKMGLLRLELAAREAQVQVAAFGHTHQPYCQWHDGLWLVNPGSAQRTGHYALVEIDQGVPHCSLHCL